VDAYGLCGWVGGKVMAEITRAELGLGLFLGYLVTPRGRIIGEIRVPEPKVAIRSLQIGKPVVAIETKETDQTTYQKMVEVNVPEGFKLSMESLSILPVTNPTYAKYKMEFDDTVIEDKDILATLTLPFRGRTELLTKAVVWIKTTLGTNPVKSQVSLIGILLPKGEVSP